MTPGDGVVDFVEADFAEAELRVLAHAMKRSSRWRRVLWFVRCCLSSIFRRKRPNRDYLISGRYIERREGRK